MQFSCKFVLNILLVLATWWFFPVLSNAAFPIYDSNAVWTDDNGQTVKLNQWRNSVSIMAMAYTECTRVCNATLHRLEEAQELADKKHIQINFIIFSFDPSIDNPASWSFYRRQHHLESRTNWHFLTGTRNDTQRLARQLGIEFWLDEDHVMHDLRIVSVNPDGSIKAFLDWDHQDVTILFK